MALSKVVDAIITIFEEETPSAREGLHFSVSKTVSTLAVLYEKARNAVEFRAEHLIRRAAIERILKRRILLNGGSTSIAENLVVELLWARYIDSSYLDDTKVADIQHIVNRYLFIRQEVFAKQSSAGGITWDLMLGLASSEIEETIVSSKRRQAMNDFFYQAVRPKIQMREADERTVNMQTYIAVERAFAQSDDPLIAYHLLEIIQPSWFTVTDAELSSEVSKFLESMTLILSSLRNPIGEVLQRYVRRQMPPYLLVRDIFFEAGKDIRTFIEDKQKFEQRLAEMASKRYQEIGAKVRRAVVRSFIYIFLTKMLFALALEVPFDIWISKRIEIIAIVINTLFPPLLLFLVAGLFQIPGPDNTRRLIDRIMKIVYSFDNLSRESDVFIPKPVVRRPILTAVFSLMYIGTFLMSFGIISFVLTHLHFNIASQIIFVFFVTLVSFFAYRIRQSAKEYEIVERQGFMEPAVDFFFLPILRAGHALSREIAKLNVFIFFFDFILEAPLKVIFEVVEEWIRFVRIKKEEIV